MQVSSPGKSLNLYPSNEYEVLPNGSEAHWEVVERILFIYAKLNPGIAYVQGMNEIVGPIYYTFATDPNDEWKGWWRKSNLLDEMISINAMKNWIMDIKMK